jgi:AhpD family alkylhydroperoxidase
MHDTHSIDAWEAERERLNELTLSDTTLGIKRFFALDHQSYEAGALPSRTKELLGLVASLVLRCDDCVTYHISRCHQEGASREEILETMNIGLVVGGSIVIPHLRRAMERLEQVQDRGAGGAGTGAE